MIYRILLTWLLFLPIPIINGGLREKWYKAKVGELGANLIGCAVLSLLFLLYAYLSLRGQIRFLYLGQIFGIGAAWLILTLTFEFGMGLAAHRSWKYMLADYNIFKGRLWPVVLAVIFFSPCLIKILFKN